MENWCNHAIENDTQKDKNLTSFLSSPKVKLSFKTNVVRKTWFFLTNDLKIALTVKNILFL